MIQLLIGHKGSGKTKSMIDLANTEIEKCDGSVIFINKDQSLMYDLKYRIRTVCMEEYAGITDAEEYIGFIYGIISSDHDIETIYIDSIMSHTDFKLSDLPEFIERLKKISELYGPNFVVSINADRAEMSGVDFSGTEVIE